MSASAGAVPSCAALCLPLWASGRASFNASASLTTDAVGRLSAAYTQATRAAQFTAVAAREAEVLRMCVDTEQLAPIKALLYIAAATRPFQTLLGIRFALRALGLLLPMNFAMMLGAFKGACVAKTMVPYSRVPGLVLVCAVVFSLPHLATIVILVKSIIGDGMILVAVLMFLCANMVYLPIGSFMRFFTEKDIIGNGLLDPDTHDKATETMERRQRAALVFNLLVGFFLVIWIFWSAPLKEFMQMGFAEVDIEKEIRENVLTVDFLKLFTLSGLNVVCKMLGISKIATIFFCDATLSAILLMDESDQSDRDKDFREEHGQKEKELLCELQHGLDPVKAQGSRKTAAIHRAFLYELFIRMPCCERCCRRKSGDIPLTSREPDNIDTE